jgi:hypothetical protein
MNLIWPARDRHVSLNMTVDLAEAAHDLGGAVRSEMIASS